MLGQPHENAVILRIKIMGKWLKVLSDKLMSENGDFEHDKLFLRYNPEQDVQQIRDTIWHEAFHMMFKESGLHLDFKEDDDEEKIVWNLSRASLEVLRDNPKLVDFLTEK